jgi:parallel beta-helix repeat protein
MKTKQLFLKTIWSILLALIFSVNGWAQYGGTGTFTKITSIGDLVEGYYVVVNSGDAFAMNATNAGSYFTHTAVSPSGGVITNPSENIVWKLEINGSSWSIFNEATSKYVSYTGTSNAAYAVDAITTDNQRWSMTYASSVFTCSNVAIPTRMLQYNASSPRFACYTTAQQKLLLYKMDQVTADPVLYGAPISISGLSYLEGNGPSTSQSFTVSGTNLDGSNVTITAPTNFKLSLSENGTYTSSLTLTSFDGTSTNIWAQLEAGLTTGNYSGNVTIAGGGATSVTVALSGTVIEAFSIPYSNYFGTDADRLLATTQGFVLSGTVAATGYTRVANSAYIETPVIDFTQYDFIKVFLSTATFGGFSGQVMNVEISDNGGSSYTTLFTAQPTSTTYVNDEVVIDLTGTYNVSNGKLRFSTVSTTQAHEIRFRNLQIEEVSAPAVSDPVFSLAAGKYYADQTVFISNFGDYETTTNVYYTLDNSDPTSLSFLYNNTTGIELTDGNGPVTLKAIAIDGTEESGITSATYTFPINVADLSELKTNIGDNKIYRITGGAVITLQGAYRNQRFIQDATAGVLIDDNLGVLGSYSVGDELENLIGKINNYSGMPQLVPDVDMAVVANTGIYPAPVTVSITNLDNSYLGRLIKVEQLTYQGTSGNFAQSQNYVFQDAGSNQITLRTIFSEPDYIGDPIPEEPGIITGVHGIFGTTLQITPRSWNDFESYPIVNLNTGQGYSTIQAAIDDANPAGGDVIVISEGTYEENLTVDKSLTLKPATGEEVILQGYGAEMDPEEPGFGLLDIGILVEADNITIEGLIILGFDFGIDIWGNNNTITDNVVTGAYAGGGISLYGSNNSITGNIINEHYEALVVSLTTGNVIQNNRIFDNSTGLINTTTSWINVASNWWGDESGPENDPYNTCGLGNVVSDYVIFWPWFTDDNEEPMTSVATLPVTNITKTPNTSYCKIQDAIDDATTGHVIQVGDGTYYENINVNVPGITIKNGSSPVIDGGGTGTVVTISANNVTFQGIKVQNSGFPEPTMQASFFPTA